jgi:DNA mismatch repair protein MutL
LRRRRSRFHAEEERLLEEHLDALSEIGLVIEPFGPGVFVVRSVPAVLADADIAETLALIIDDLENWKSARRRSR